MTTRIAVLGAGAIGSVVGGVLARAHLDPVIRMLPDSFTRARRG